MAGAYDVQKMTHKAEQEGNFENIFSGAKGGTVILSLEGEKSTENVCHRQL